MFAPKSFRSWDHWDKSFFLDRQPAGTGRRHRNTDHTAEGGGATRVSQDWKYRRSPTYQPKKWRHMGISPGDEWGGMAPWGVPFGLPRGDIGLPFSLAPGLVGLEVSVDDA